MLSFVFLRYCGISPRKIYPQFLLYFNTQLKRRGRSWGDGLRGWFVELLQVGGNHLRRSRGWIC